VYKLRGSDYLAGAHSFKITSDGITVFPRFTTPDAPLFYEVSRERARTGIPGMDDVLFPGGILRGTTTLVVGDPGVGKTVTALHFLLNGAREGEPGAYISFQEDPSQLRRIARNFGFDLPTLSQRGNLAMLYSSPVELNIDEHAQKIVTLLQEINAQRVVIDSVGDLEAGAQQDPDRFFNFVYALVQWFKTRSITALLTAEMGQLFANELTLTGRGVSHIADNIVLIRYTEIDGEILRALTVLSARGSEHSKQVREYIITEAEGPRIGPPLHSAYSLFAPTARLE
jgi:circadian clock protein KaiC